MKLKQSPTQKTPSEEIYSRLANIESFVRMVEAQVQGFGDQLGPQRLAGVAQLVELVDDAVMGLYQIFMDVANASGGQRDIEQNPSLSPDKAEANHPGDAADLLLAAAGRR